MRRRTAHDRVTALSVHRGQVIGLMAVATLAVLGATVLAAIVAAVLVSTPASPSLAQGGGYWQPQHVATNNSNDEPVRR